eukprot:425615_1
MACKMINSEMDDTSYDESTVRNVISEIMLTIYSERNYVINNAAKEIFHYNLLNSETRVKWNADIVSLLGKSVDLIMNLIRHKYLEKFIILIYGIDSTTNSGAIERYEFEVMYEKASSSKYDIFLPFYEYYTTHRFHNRKSIHNNSIIQLKLCLRKGTPDNYGPAIQYIPQYCHPNLDIYWTHNIMIVNPPNTDTYIGQLGTEHFCINISVSETTFEIDSNYSKILKLETALRLHTQPFIFKQCNLRVHWYINSIQKNMNATIPPEIINLCFQFYYLNAPAISSTDVYDYMTQFGEKYDFNYDTFIQQTLLSDSTDEHLLHVIQHIERGHKFSVLTPDHLFDVIVFSYLDYYAAKWCKNRGNNYFPQGKYQESLKCYSNAASHVGADMETNTIYFSQNGVINRNDSVKFLQLAAFNNTAAVYLKLKDYENVIEKTSVVLDIDPNNEKALFRRGRAYRKSGQLKKAVNDLVAVGKKSRAEGNMDPAIERELVMLKHAIGKQDMKKWLLNDMELIQYYDCFINSGFNSLAAVKKITMNDLNKMDIETLDKTKLLNGIQVLNQSTSRLFGYSL